MCWSNFSCRARREALARILPESACDDFKHMQKIEKRALERSDINSSEASDADQSQKRKRVSPDRWWWNLCVSALELKAPLTVTPNVTLQDTLDLLNKEAFDQVPVVGESGEIQGMVTVGNILAQMVKNKVKPSDPVSKIMYKQFKKIHMDTRLGQLSRMLDTDHFVLVVHNQRQYRGSKNAMEKKQMIFGIATRIDLLNFIASHEANKTSD